MRRQRTQPRRKRKTQVGTPTQRSPGGFGGIESGLWRSSALTFCRPFEAAEHVERRRWSNDGVEREASTTLASEAIYLENAPKQIGPSMPSRSALTFLGQAFSGLRFGWFRNHLVAMAVS